MSSNVDTKCQNCGNQDGISADQLKGHTICLACKDIALFKQPPPNEDCPICFLTLPSLHTGRKYKTCCGQMICSGCIHAVDKMKGGFQSVPSAEFHILYQTRKLLKGS